jgi:hypothetical protein
LMKNDTKAEDTCSLGEILEVFGFRGRNYSISGILMG